MAQLNMEWRLIPHPATGDSITTSVRWEVGDFMISNFAQAYDELSLQLFLEGFLDWIVWQGRNVASKSKSGRERWSKLSEFTGSKGANMHVRSPCMTSWRDLVWRA